MLINWDSLSLLGRKKDIKYFWLYEEFDEKRDTIRDYFLLCWIWSKRLSESRRIRDKR